jgi:hypothetical protein
MREKEIKREGESRESDSRYVGDVGDVGDVEDVGDGERQQSSHRVFVSARASV